MTARGRRRLTATLGATALITSLAGTVPVAASPWPTPVRQVAALRDTAVFNDPTQPGSQERIVEHLRSLIRGAGAGSEIRAALHRFDLADLAADLIGARQRGVDVKVVLDYAATETVDDSGATIPTPAFTTLAAGLGTNSSATSWAIRCTQNGACIGNTTTGEMHNRFFTFSNTQGAANVVVQTSSDLTNAARENAWNDAVTLVGNTALYNAYTSYVTDLAAMKKNANYSRTTTAGNVTAYFHPRAIPTPPSRAVDDISTILSKVTCSSGSQLRVATETLTRIDIAKKLWDLDHQGCSVYVLYTELSPEAKAQLTAPGGSNGGPEIKSSVGMYTAPDGSLRRTRLTLTYLTISSSYAGSPQKIVATGSHTYSTESQHHNDDALLEIKDNVLHDQYLLNFQHVWISLPEVVR